jgi:O-antigen ligase
MKSAAPTLPSRVLNGGVVALLVGMPFHAMAAISLGYFIGGQAYWQAWKELLIIGMIGLAVFIFASSKRRVFRFDAANISALILITLGLFITIISAVPAVQAAFGLKVVVLPLVLYLIMQLGKVQFSEDTLGKLILWPAYVVSILAILQEFVIPLNWWSAIGYSEATIRPLQLVDPAVKSIRAFATLGGPNQMGAYLILPTLLGAAMFFRTKQIKFGAGAVLTLSGVIFSFSRSAWLGMATAALVAIIVFGNRLIRFATAFLVGAAIIVLITISATLPARLQNTQLQYFLLHGRYSQTQEIEGSDSGRITALNTAVESVRDHPWGNGLGTAGPASFRSAQPVITENWYLQVAIEIGILGVVLFVLFFGANIFELIRSKDLFWQVLGASICGLLVTNLFLHAWADSTLGIIIFSLMGIGRNRSA